MGIAINTGTEITRSVLDMVVVELSTSGQQELAQIARNFVVRAEVVHREALLIELSNKE
ncbi:MAG: hypothetical protein GQ570_03705 [Helicobacteraceae bacterium]|nr:hypothetical protein [Helicobacteraceae bacterium]